MQVTWGQISMVDAERRLLANAFQDYDNHRFLLLSDRQVFQLSDLLVFN